MQPLKICYTNPCNIKPNTAVLILDFKVQAQFILGRHLFPHLFRLVVRQVKFKVRIMVTDQSAILKR